MVQLHLHYISNWAMYLGRHKDAYLYRMIKGLEEENKTRREFRCKFNGRVLGAHIAMNLDALQDTLAEDLIKEN